MKNVIRIVSRVVYLHGIKPMLFRRSPDDVHRDLVRLATFVQRVPLVRSLPMLWSHSDKRLVQTIAGVTFKNPVGLERRI